MAPTRAPAKKAAPPPPPPTLPPPTQAQVMAAEDEDDDVKLPPPDKSSKETAVRVTLWIRPDLLELANLCAQKLGMSFSVLTGLGLQRELVLNPHLRNMPRLQALIESFRAEEQRAKEKAGE